MPAIEVDLQSDTVTKPTPEMRRFMCDAEVGDEQRFADPTTRLLQERVAELLGHEAGLFLPSGTMCNQIAIRLHIRPGGDELILEAQQDLLRPAELLHLHRTDIKAIELCAQPGIIRRLRRARLDHDAAARPEERPPLAPDDCQTRQHEREHADTS